MELIIQRGDVVLCDLTDGVGCEIGKRRPATVVSADANNRNERNRIVLIVPIATLRPGHSARRDEVVLQPGPTGLTATSVTVCNQVRSVDRERLVAWLGQLDSTVMRAIDRRLSEVFGIA